MERIVEHTADGSATLYIPEMDEHYHSVKGAETESRHVFIDTGLKAIRQTAPINVLEIGFGTGLNAFLTLKEPLSGTSSIHYTGIELYPLTWITVEALNYTSDPVFRKLHDAPWNKEQEIVPGFTLHKIQTDFTRYPFKEYNSFDLVYFDAFAPEKQPEMWQPEIFEKLFSIMNPGGVLTTYCAKGIVRRTMQQAGFTVERLPGPPGGKREILRARKLTS